MPHILFGSERIEFTLEYRERKTLSIQIHPEGSVTVLAPILTKEDDVLAKVRSKAPWILKQIAQFNTYRPATPPRRFLNGETHLYLGRQYRLKIVQNDIDAVKAYRGQMIIHAKNIDPASLKLQLDKWYKDRAELVFEGILNEVLPKFRRYKISKPELTLRIMAKRWGSCTPAGRIILNTELIKAPKGCAEYVIIHELCHLVHHNHTSAFWALQARMMPDWKKWKERLEYGLL